VTLRFFGELSADEVTAATVALRLAAEPMTAPVSARGGPNTRLLGPGLVIWPVEGLEAAARELQRATAGIGEAVSERRYLGHLTIARGRRGLDLRSVHDLLAPLEMRWPVTLISLVRSELRPDRARYRTIEEIGLGDSPSGIP
jgi:2'-5' RNA ligase